MGSPTFFVSYLLTLRHLKLRKLLELLLIRYSNSGLCVGLVLFVHNIGPLPMIHSNESLEGLILRS